MESMTLAEREERAAAALADAQVKYHELIKLEAESPGTARWPDGMLERLGKSLDDVRADVQFIQDYRQRVKEAEEAGRQFRQRKQEIDAIDAELGPHIEAVVMLQRKRAVASQFALAAKQNENISRAQAEVVARQHPALIGGER